MRKYLPRLSRPLGIAFIVAIFSCSISAWTLGDYGITWDEAVYFRAGTSYADWLRHPSSVNIDRNWQINHEHPPLVKVMGGITHIIFHEKLGWTGSIVAYRAASIIFVFLTFLFLYLFAFALAGHYAALLTTAMFFCLPRLFFHSHLLAFDYPMAALWLMTIYALQRGEEDRRWHFAAGFFLGLALLTKINAIFLYIPVLLYIVFIQSPGILKLPLGCSLWKEEKFRKAILSLAIFTGIPAVMFIVLWPWLWDAPLDRVAAYFAFHLQHLSVFTYYMGMQTPAAPWHYPFVMTAVTTPALILILFFYGLFNIVEKRDRAGALLIINALLPFVIVALPGVPKYDGVRLFLPAFPFICLIAGIGIHRLLSAFASMKVRRSLLLLCFLLLAVTAYKAIIRIHPYQSSYYNAFAEETGGAAVSGFEADYWGHPLLYALPWLNEHSDKRFWLYMAELEPKIMWGIDCYKKDGLLRKSVPFGDKDSSDYLVLLIRQGFFSNRMWDFYINKKPVYSVKAGQTPLINIYRLNRR